MSRKLRWLVAAMLLALAGIAAVNPSVQHAGAAIWKRNSEFPRPRPASDADQAAILRAVILQLAPHPTSIAARKGLPWKPVLAARTFELCPPTPGRPAFPRDCTDDPDADFLLDDGDWFPDIPLRLRQELVAANRDAGAQADPHFDGVAIVGEAALAKAPRRLGTTRAVLSEDGDTALIAIAQACGLLCGSGDAYLLERHGDDWVIVSAQSLWMS